MAGPLHATDHVTPSAEDAGTLDDVRRPSSPATSAATAPTPSGRP